MSIHSFLKPIQSASFKGQIEAASSYCLNYIYTS
uniref:Uncharacterized protein n=1 Tax=Anguilla anguilla TaxID=7936 RepID=A0A0E9TGD3_ANGAN